MYRFASRAGRLRHILTIIAVSAVGACADDQPITAPQQNASEPRVVTAGAGALETTDALVITIVPDREGTIRTYSGISVVSGTVTCSQSGGQFTLVGYLSQYQRKEQQTVEGYGDAAMTCTTSAQPWELLVVPNAGKGPPKRGRADMLFRAMAAGVPPGDVERTIRLVEVAGY
jgi:hypothetical protein